MDDRGIVRRHPFEELAGLRHRQPRNYLTCPSCGKKVRQKTYSIRCRSCGSSLLAGADFSGRVPPDGVLPFEIERAEAKKIFTDWLRSRRLAPGGLRVIQRAEEIEGVFFPFWSISAQTSTTYNGQSGVTRYRTQTRAVTDARCVQRNETSTVTYIEWHRARGRVDRYFDEIVIPACSTLPAKLPTWPLDDVLPYEAPAVTGFGVVPYDIEPETGLARAKTRMRAGVAPAIRADIGGEQQRIHSYETSYHREVFSLLLFPAWLLSYRHQGVTRTAFVNGVSGEVIGDRPYSRVKIALLALLGAAVVGAAAFFLALR